MVEWTPIKGSATNLLVLAYPTHCPTLQTPPPFLWPDIRLSKLWLLGNYYKVPTSMDAVLIHSHVGYIHVDMMKQGLALAKKPHIVIATPGRLADHLANTDTVSLKRIRFLVRAL